MRYTKEQLDFVRTVAQGRYNDEIAEMFNQQFGTDITANMVKALKNNYKITSGVPKHKPSDDRGLLNKEQKAYARENATGRTNKELADLLNSRFGLSLTAKQMNSWKKNHDVISGLVFRYPKGHVPVNKGTKGKYNVGGNRTSFRAGEQPLNYKPVGYERVDHDGYILVKVQDDGPWHQRWRLKHKIVWEEAHGPVPAGHALVFADQNRLNVTLENLILVPQSILSVLNKKKLLYKNADFTRSGIIIAGLYRKIAERKKKSR